MIFLLIATIFQSLAQKSAIKRLNRKENAFALGTLDFTQINQARKCNFLCLAILQSEHVKKFLFTIRPFFFLLTGQRRETRRRGRFGRPARGFGQPGRRGGSRLEPRSTLGLAGEGSGGPATAAATGAPAADGDDAAR